MKDILAASAKFDKALYSKLLTRPAFDKSEVLPILFNTEISQLLKSIEHDFPEIAKLSSIGKTF